MTWARSSSPSAAMLRRNAASAARLSSMKTAALAPRDKASRPTAPVPANASSTGRSAKGSPDAANRPCDRMLNRASRARSLVGRTVSPTGATSRRPRCTPPTIRNPRDLDRGGALSEERIFDDKENGQSQHRRAYLGKAPRQQFDRGIGDKAESDAVGDRESERHRQRRHDRRRVFSDVVPIELGKTARHQTSDE